MYIRWYSFSVLLGKILTSTDSVNGEIPNGEYSYVEVQNGSDVTLTIDVNIQSIAEKYCR